MTRTSAVSFEALAVCQGGLAVIRPTISSQFKKTISLMMAFILALLLVVTTAKDLKADTPPAYIPLNADQLDQLVAPVALDPDPLVAQILTASTYPDQVAAADTWSNLNLSLPAAQRASGADGMAWDPAIKGLIEFPDVLDNLAKNGAWTAQLGNAYFNQPDDVMNAIQALRTQAHQSNVLVTTPQERVVMTAGVIEVVPADPAVVYVPYYNPWRIWGTLFVAYPGFVVEPPPVGVVAVSGIAFEPPVAVAAYVGFGWGISAWTPAWTGGLVLFNHSTYISSSTTVINHGYFGGHDHGAFEHGGRGVPSGYHACAHSGAGRTAAERERANGGHARSSYGHQGHSGNAAGSHSQARNGYSSGNRSKSSSGYKSGTHAQAHNSYSPSQAHNSYGKGTRNSSQARNSQSSRMGTHSQARNTSRSGMSRSQAGNANRSGMNHSQARNTSRSGMSRSQAGNANRSGMNHSQARNTSRSGMSRSQAGNANRSGMNHSQARNTNRSAMNHSPARSNARATSANRSQARNNTRSSGMNRSQARTPRSTGAGNRPQPRTVANRQSAGGHSAGGRASGGKRR